ncbi:neutral/alkaline non-lysosomal ceramidase N-terminal domain-containing protein [Luteolibacter yonseiensis]|uniref:Neutral ceramidase n=1 Tax=Luteolibacter yonseiensis TaxID=1144680 RepID=A0A934R6S7_9BACT|nr:neutral/alkaline non-lysosomal ceramidase N-terminal domain-containing protein [Luteolibacter yonseiensis]MBK1816169.1 neutral/alkaline non-lysosomal ceramidase N-terminal domain-containing protein [Luteolibacter yonseiensis]
MVYQIGAAKADITAFRKGVGMMGYGMFHQYVEGVETPLSARAVVIKAGDRKLALVNAEIWSITLAVRSAVMERIAHLGFDEESVMLTAQHTHSGPGGYSHYALYNMSVPGFVPEVFEGIVKGIVDAIAQADGQAHPGTIRHARGEFPPDVEVAFNRSLEAYNRNVEVVESGGGNENMAIDRSMLLFRFDALDGAPLATWNFFGVHTTSLSNDNHRISPDNKGYAAELMERGGGIAVFAQRKAGDVTPNHVFDHKKKWTRGKYEDDFESARDNGRMQYEQAVELFANAAGKEAMRVEIDPMLSWMDFSRAAVHPAFSHGEKNAGTGLACHGVAFARGTREGPGMPMFLAGIATALSRGLKAWELFSSRWRSAEAGEKIRLKYEAQGAKSILFEAGERRILGIRNISLLPLPGAADGALAAFKKFYKNGSLADKPWIPQVLPLQLVIFGDHAFAGVPGEVTTIAGQRIEKTLLDILSARGVTEVVVASYCNGYCGYISTFEEYGEQAYEGGHTVFGKHTLGAVLTRFSQMALEMLKPAGMRSESSDGVAPEFSDEELASRSFDAKVRGG